MQNRGSDRRSDGFTVSTRGEWSERGVHRGTLAPLAAPNSVYTVPEIVFAKNAGGQDIAHVRWILVGNVAAARRRRLGLASFPSRLHGGPPCP